MRFMCKHTEIQGGRTVRCPFPCFEYEKLQLKMISKHRDRGLAERRHENVITLEEVVSEVVEEGHGSKLIEIILKKMGKENLTEVFEKV